MVKKKGLVGQIYKACESAGALKPMAVHCIIFRQALGGKSLDVSCLMGHIVTEVGFAPSHGLDHSQFRAFIHEKELQTPDLSFHTQDTAQTSRASHRN